jgi:ribosome-associated heat shock protein Hsp15
MNTSSEHTAPARADKWLWAARFFKTRALATAAINGGKVHVNGERIKPGRRLVPGDKLTIRKGPYSLAVSVERLSVRRGPAAEAQTLYRESEESMQQRLEISRQRQLEGRSPGQHERRPDKRARRQIRQFREHMDR